MPKPEERDRRRHRSGGVLVHSNAQNRFHHATGYSNTEVDRLLEAQLETYHVDERKRLVADVQRRVAEYRPGGFGPGIPNVYNRRAYATRRKHGLDVRSE